MSVTASGASLLPGPPNPIALDTSQGNTTYPSLAPQRSQTPGPVHPHEAKPAHVQLGSPFGHFQHEQPSRCPATRTQKGIGGSLDPTHSVSSSPLPHIGTPSQTLGCLSLRICAAKASTGLSLRNALLLLPLPSASTNLLYLKPKTWAAGPSNLKTLFFQPLCRSRAVKG